MSSEARAPQGSEWNDAVDVLHLLTNALMVRNLYQENHPAIARADQAAAEGFERLFTRLPELVLALLDGEFVVAERPMPELRKRLATLAHGMQRLEIDCLVLQRGITRAECSTLARTLGGQRSSAPMRQARDAAQAALPHVLLRHAQLRGGELLEQKGTEATSFVQPVGKALFDARQAIASEQRVDRAAILELAERIVRSVEEGLFTLHPVAWAPGVDNEPVHATNVATMVAAMGFGAGLSDRTCIDVTAAALVHDVGRTLLPEEIRGLPEPQLTEEQRGVYRHHAFVGASALLGAGAPPLWVAAALEHHRGVDGKGYPVTPSQAPPDRLVRLIALASFLDTRRARYDHQGDDPVQALEAAFALEGRFFGSFELRAYLRAIGPYPPGTTVELSDRQIAIVTKVNVADPERPHVRIVCGPDEGKRAELAAFDAQEDRHPLSIVRPVPPPLMLRPGGIARLAVSSTNIVAATAEMISEEPVDVTVIDAQEVSAPARELDMPVPLRSSVPPARLSGFYSSARREEPVEEDTHAPLRFSPASSVPPPIRGPRQAASLRMPAVQPEPPKPPSQPPPRNDPAGIPLDKVPHLLVGPAQIAKLPLDPQAGFVLSLIDGMSTVENVADASGLPAEEVIRIFGRLLEMGAIALR